MVAVLRVQDILYLEGSNPLYDICILTLDSFAGLCRYIFRAFFWRCRQHVAWY